MTTAAQRRLLREFRKFQDDPPLGVTGAPTEDNILKWDAIIFGPEDTPFEGGTFKLTIDFTENYPHDPPKVKFVTKMFHPNIYQDGSICLDILSDKWSPTFDISVTLHSIQSLLDDPNPHSPANGLAADLFMKNKSEYIRKVASSVEKSWNDEIPDSDNDSLYDEDPETDFVPEMEDVVVVDPFTDDFGLKLLFNPVDNDVIGPLFHSNEDNVLGELFDEEPEASAINANSDLNMPLPMMMFNANEDSVSSALSDEEPEVSDTDSNSDLEMPLPTMMSNANGRILSIEVEFFDEVWSYRAPNDEVSEVSDTDANSDQKMTLPLMMTGMLAIVAICIVAVKIY